MIEHKFRVWIVEENKFFYFTLEEILKRNDGNYSGDYDHKIYNNKKRDLCTDRKDKNGIEIYKGDLCYLKNCTDLYEVKWYKKQSAFCFYGVNCELLRTMDEKCKIIGNIHENPELIGG